MHCVDQHRSLRRKRGALLRRASARRSSFKCGEQEDRAVEERGKVVVRLGSRRGEGRRRGGRERGGQRRTPPLRPGHAHRRGACPCPQRRREQWCENCAGSWAAGPDSLSPRLTVSNGAWFPPACPAALSGAVRPIYSVDVQPGDERIATGGAGARLHAAWARPRSPERARFPPDGAVRIWKVSALLDALDGKEHPTQAAQLAAVTHHQDSVNCVRWAPSGRSVPRSRSSPAPAHSGHRLGGLNTLAPPGLPLTASGARGTQVSGLGL